MGVRSLIRPRSVFRGRSRSCHGQRSGRVAGPAAVSVPGEEPIRPRSAFRARSRSGRGQCSGGGADADLFMVTSCNFSKVNPTKCRPLVSHKLCSLAVTKSDHHHQHCGIMTLAGHPRLCPNSRHIFSSSGAPLLRAGTRCAFSSSEAGPKFTGRTGQ